VAIGEIEAADVILDSPWEAESMAVAELLMSQRRLGPEPLAASSSARSDV